VTFPIHFRITVVHHAPDLALFTLDLQGAAINKNSPRSKRPTLVHSAWAVPHSVNRASQASLRLTAPPNILR
jgi:hypothetical protein